MELVCPAGNLPSLRAAVANGADAVYVGLRDGTNARHFPGLNFDDPELAQARRITRDAGVRLFMAVNTYAQAGRWQEWARAVDQAAHHDVDVLIAADIAVLDDASSRHPELPLHLSVQGSATNHLALAFYHERFGIRRAVLPRVLSLTQVQRLAARSPVELEVFGFGSLCIMVEGRCQLSSWVTGHAPNTCGACSPARFVEWRDTEDSLEARLNGQLIDRFAEGEAAGYPVVCKGRYMHASGRIDHALEEPVSLNTLHLLPELTAAGVVAVKLEGRQRSPAYIARATRVWREALDASDEPVRDAGRSRAWDEELAALSEGRQTTLGALDRAWQ